MKTAKTTEFLKECLSDSLLKLMGEKDFGSITIDEIAKGAGVNRSTWFRNFADKQEAMTFKLVKLWYRYTEEHDIKERNKYTFDNALDFFRFNYEYRAILKKIFDAKQHTAVYNAFYIIMQPQFEDDPKECYNARFYSYGMYGLMDEWGKRDFNESPETMAGLFKMIISNK